MNRKKFISAMGLGASAMIASGCRTVTPATSTLPDYDSINPSDFWAAIRDKYPLGTDRVYLNCGGLGPAPTIVLDSVNSKMLELQGISETGYAIMDQARIVTADYLGADTDEICFTRNATESNSIIAVGLNLEKGDEVIFESHAHPGGSFPWLNRQKRHGIKIKMFDPDPDSMDGSVERILRLITPRPRVIQVSHITAPTGILFDVKAIGAIAREWGIWFHVDGAQTAGMIPVDLHDMDCDSYATSGHKWMGGPRGTGILFIKKDRLEAVECSHIGGHSESSYELPNELNYKESARRHEYGTRNTELVEGLRVAIEFQNSIGIERIETYGSELANYLRAGLSDIESVRILTPSDPQMRRSITTFACSKISFDTLTSRLMREYRLRCRQVSERGLNAVRVSTHIFNSKSDCDRVIEAVSEIVRAV
ncbi:MAG: aminotransferase class V-fold PLP-dependent enzyme [Bacteroidetes bacterium]|nr:aminotransferase class V-fold PLP-dependent enzyme [Bacteroidota bacterium]